MLIQQMKLSEMKKPEKNVRMHTDQQLREFERSVKMFGQIRPIVVDENNTILAGNGLYDTLVRMGIEIADVYQYKNLTENQKKKLMIADNKIFSLGIDNLDTLNSFLEEMNGDLDIPGFDSEILKQMVSDAEEVTGKISEYGTLDQSEIDSIKNHSSKPKEPEHQEAAPQSNEGSTTNQESENGSTTYQETDGGESDSNGKFIVCPKCGEKIWL